MKIVKVIYTAKADYVAQNQQNIHKVMSDLQALAHDGIFYHVCLGSDGKTFTHTAFFKEDANQQVLSDLPSFQAFQHQLKDSGPEAPPAQDHMTLVGSSSNIF